MVLWHSFAIGIHLPKEVLCVGIPLFGSLAKPPHRLGINAAPSPSPRDREAPDSMLAEVSDDVDAMRGLIDALQAPLNQLDQQGLLDAFPTELKMREWLGIRSMCGRFWTMIVFTLMWGASIGITAGSM